MQLGLFRHWLRVLRPFLPIQSLQIFITSNYFVYYSSIVIFKFQRQKMEVDKGNNRRYYFIQTQHVKNNLQNQQKDSIIIIIYYAVIYFLRIALTTIVWTANESQDNAFSLNDLVQNIKASVIYQMVLAVLIFLKIIALILIFFKNIGKENQFFQKILKQKTRMQTQYKQMDLILTAILLCIDWRVNIVPFIFSILLQVYDILLCQNYIIRKSPNYIKDSKAYFIYRTLVVLSLIVNAIAVNIQMHHAYRIIFMALSGLFYLWYMTVGKQIFKKQSLNMLTSAQVSIFVALAYGIAKNIINQTYFQASKSILEVAMVAFMLMIISEMNKSFIKYRLFDKILLKHQELKEYDLMITSSLEKINELPEFDALLSGKLAYSKANNPFLQTKTIGKFNNRPGENLGKENQKQFFKERLAKDHIQQCYQQELQRNNFDKKLLLQYCQFLYNEHGSIYRLIVLLNILELKNLDLIEKATVFKYRFLVQSIFKKLNGYIYEGRLKFEHIIQCQENINGVYDKIVNYLNGYKQIWDNLGQTEVDMELVQKGFGQNLQLLKQIDKNWSKIRDFFSENKYWKRIYYNYLLFIKNERIKQKQLDDLKEYDADKQSLKIIRQSTSMSAKAETFNPAIIFNKNVAYIKAIYHDKQLLIKNVSHNFEYLTNFEQAQLRGCNIEALMPRDLRQKHQDIVNNWMVKGELVNEQRYEIRETQLVVKDGTRKVIKLFKTCFSIQSGLAFVCFLKFEDHIVNTKNSEKFFDCYEPFSKFSSNDSTGKQSFSNGSSEIRQTQESNIFIKQQAMDCPQQNRQISLIKLAGRILCIFTILLLVISLTILNSNCNALIDHSDQFVNYMYIYRYPIVLNINYMRTFLNLGNQATAKNAIISNTKAMIAATSNQLTLKSLYDQGLNPPNIYYPDTSYSSEFTNITYNQIDLFFLIQSSVSSLSNLPINRTSKQYKQFAAFLKPAYDTMVNITKNKLHQTLQTLILTINYVYVQITIIELTVLSVFTIYMLIKMNKLFGKRKIIISIINDFFQDHHKAISNYHHSVKNHFYGLFNKGFQGGLKQSKQVSPKRLQNVLTPQNLNKRLKVLSQNSNYHRKYHLIRLFLIISQLFLLFLFISFIVYEISKIKYLQSFQQAGFNFLRYFPTAPIITMGALEKYYSLQYPKQKSFDPKKYDDVISSMFLFGNFAYIGDLQEDSLYFQKQKNYYFGNPCTYNPSILVAAGLNAATCQSISNGIFRQGISAYLRYSQKLGSSYIRGEANLTSAQVNEYVLSVNYLTTFVLDSISTWIKQFQSKIKDFHRVSETLGVIIISLMIVLHIILNQFVLTGILEKQYVTIRQIYNFFVPQFILQQDKVVMQKFIMEDFANRK